MILILAACGGGETANDGGSWLEPATSTMPEPATAPQTEAGTTVLVTVNDGHVATRESAIPIGPAVLTVMNAGKEVHGLHVEGPGVQAALESTLATNESGTLSVTFQNGEYTLYCPVLDHRNNGETLTMTVPTQQ
ncbi:MAG TPA: hypothetical protein VFT12_05165 [Thermoanaerobaculia bacterium]|nr:hypothetical protein [Thermoanaerobaculia bacterium]